MTIPVPGLPEGVMGRAGMLPPGFTVQPKYLDFTDAASPVFHLPDMSEFQPDVNWGSLIASNGGAAVIRAMYGSDFVDSLWSGGRRAAAHAAGIEVLGIYQYVRADQDAVTQALALKNQVGSLQPGEFIVMDLEEGAGNQLSRAVAYLAAIDSELPSYPGYTGAWLYSGLNFALTAGLSPIFTSGQVNTWVAAYSTVEPALPHTLWQHSNGSVDLCSFEPWAGVGFCDCSRLPGALATLSAIVSSAPATTTLLGDEMFFINNLAVNGGKTPVAIPNGAARLRFFSNEPATLQVDDMSGNGLQELTLGYGQKAQGITVAASCAVVHRTDAGVNPVACTSTA